MNDQFFEPMQSQSFVFQMCLSGVFFPHHLYLPSGRKPALPQSALRGREICARRKNSMSVLFDHTPLRPAHAARPAFRSRMAALFSGLARRLANRAAIRQLAEADEFMLHDIGLTRSAVDTALRAPPFADPMAHAKAFSAGQRPQSSSR
jgi:uncharacterized protein YjiS (DUF1127 family)